jgi:hypothetical protein
MTIVPETAWLPAILAFGGARAPAWPAAAITDLSSYVVTQITDGDASSDHHGM